MIQLPNQLELDELKAFKQPFCLTIYTFFIESNTETNPNRIELKNLLREGEKALLAAGMQPKEVKKSLKPVRALLEDHEFWQTDYESLVFFIHPTLFRYYHIPKSGISNMVSVQNSFNVGLVEKALGSNKQYYVLTLSHHDISLYEGDHFKVKLLHLDGFPSDMNKTLNIDEYPHSRQLHVVAPASAGKGSEGYHEQYEVSKTDKIMLLQFFRRIDKQEHAFFRTKQFPLIIGGVNYLLPIYRLANTYPHLLDDGIAGNLERETLPGIQKKAWRILSGIGTA